MVIFYRTNAQSRLFEDILLSNYTPYVIVGGVSFYQRREIKDILAFLRMVQSDADFVSFMRTINLPKRGIGDATVGKLNALSRQMGVSILQLCAGIVDGSITPQGIRLSAKQKAGIQDYVSIIRALKATQQSEPISSIVMGAIQNTGYLDYLRADKETFEDRRDNVNQLVSKATEWENSVEDPTLDKFLEELSLTTTLDDTLSTEDRINLMTIHNGKGLEYDITFLVGLEEDLFPHANSRGNADALEEERRLCYVGMTRAKEQLYLSHTRFRYIWNDLRSMRSSRFLKEIPEEYIVKLGRHERSRY
jgi:DNA helicase-2/ATP-dependent DNA helicase PcrA